MGHEFDKPHWWRKNLSWILGTSRLLKNGKLVVSYVEMMGLSGASFFDMLRPHLPAPEQFIGVENDVETLTRLYIRFREEEVRPTIVKGDVYRVAKDVSAVGELRAAVFNFDTTNVLGESSLDSSRGDLIVEVVQAAIERCGACVLILNYVLDRGTGSNKQRLREHSEVLARYFKPWQLTANRLIGSDLSGVEDRDYVGPVGAYDVYRSEVSEDRQRHGRMITLRLRFQTNGVRLEHEPRATR